MSAKKESGSVMVNPSVADIQIETVQEQKVWAVACDSVRQTLDLFNTFAVVYTASNTANSFDF